MKALVQVTTRLQKSHKLNGIVEARELTINHLTPFLQENGFSIKLNKAMEAQIERKSTNGLDSIGIRMLDYRPYYRIVYGFNKVSFSINDILLRLQENVALSPKIEKKSRFLFFSYNTIHNPSETDYLPDMLTEADVVKAVQQMLDFMTSTAFPLLGKYDDFKEIDRIINGETPWVDDWHKEFALGNDFRLNRLIIAKLAGNSRFDELVDLNYKQSENQSAQNGYPFTYDRNDLNKPLPALINLLNRVKPLY